MSVFTPVAVPALARWLAACGAGALRVHHGLEGGVENSNYFVETDRGRFVLTLFEWQPAERAERTLALTAALADDGLPVARPWPQPDGWTSPLAGKPAALAEFLPGTHPDTPTPEQCTAIGAFLGSLHVWERRNAPRTSRRVASLPHDPRGPAWLHTTAAILRDGFSAADRALLDTALAEAAELPDLPAGTIHADLFRDNALFDGGRLVGVIDFHYACVGRFMYDVAVAALDWCPDAARLRALCSAYAAVRAPDPAERAAFAALVRAAALRFWLSRAYDAGFPRPGRAVTAKDPGAMRDRLAALRAEPLEWPE